MKKSIFSKIIAMILLLTVSVLIPLSAVAAEPSSTGSVTVKFYHDHVPVKGVHFSIYHIANMRSSEYYSTETFAQYPVSFENLDTDSLIGLAAALSSYIARDSIAAVADGETKDDGIVVFNDLKIGLYLIIGDVITIGNKIYTPKPFIVSVPYVDVNKNLSYDVVAEAKFDSSDIPQKGDTVERSVRKIWIDDGNKNAHPSSIVVQLLKDGEIYDEVTLNESNNWRHTWNDLDAAYVWLVAEKTVADNYTVSTEQQGTTFYITNTYNKSDKPDSPSDTTDPSKPDNTTDPGKPSNPTSPSNPNNTTKPTNPNQPTTKPSPLLPQTGQLWWPVPLFISIGLILFGLGIVLKKRNEKNET